MKDREKKGTKGKQQCKQEQNKKTSRKGPTFSSKT